MKKILLVALMAGVGLGAYAQNKMDGIEKIGPKQDMVIDWSTKTASVKPSSHDVQLPNPKGTNDVELVAMGKSGAYGVYSVLTSYQRCLSYLPDLGVVSFVHRGQADEYPGSDNSTIMASWSGDNGATFDKHIVLAESGGVRNRYPSGVLYNPAGNTDPNNAFIIGAGPSISASGSTWDQNFFASTQLDGSNANTDQIAYVSGHQDGSELVRSGMGVTSEGKVLIASNTYTKKAGANSAASDLDLVSFIGTKDGNAWTWERQAQRVDAAAGSDGTLNYGYESGAAFAANGSIGYKWLLAQKADMTTAGGIQPVIYYTEDAGATWTEMPQLNLADNAVISEDIARTHNSDGSVGPVWPMFRETASVVDVTGNLQMMAKISATYSTHIDSVGYYQANKKTMIYNFTFDKTGMKSVIKIDSVIGKDVTKTNAGEYCFGGEAGWDSRLQASVSNDGTMIAAIWGDTENAATYNGYNAAPDIKGTGRRLSDAAFGLDRTTNKVPNYTSEAIYAGTLRFSYAAPVGKSVMYNGEDHLLVPVSTSITFEEFDGGSEDATITHSLVNVDGLGGIPIVLPPAGVEDVTSATEAFTLSQNQPNPFSGTTTITVSSSVVAPVSVEVANIMGQTVMTQSEGTINGSKQITIDASNLEAGIYFYTVRVGANSQTKKMMVK